MKIIYPIDIHLDRREPCPILDAVQGECGRAVAVSLFKDGQPWAIPTGAHVVVRYARPDACGGVYDTLPDGNAACAVQGNVITAQLVPQALAVAGMVSVQLAITSAGAQLATFIFLVRVEPDPSVGTAAGEEYVNLLPQVVQGIADAKEAAMVAKAYAEKAKMTAASISTRYQLTYTAHALDAQTGAAVSSDKAIASNLFPLIGGKIGVTFSTLARVRLFLFDRNMNLVWVDTEQTEPFEYADLPGAFARLEVSYNGNNTVPDVQTLADEVSVYIPNTSAQDADDAEAAAQRAEAAAQRAENAAPDGVGGAATLQPLIFSGAVEVTYNGTTPINVAIPRGGLTAAQITALDELFKIAAYTEDASAKYAAFRVAFGLDDSGEAGGDEPEEPDVPPVDPDEPEEPDVPGDTAEPVYQLAEALTFDGTTAGSYDTGFALFEGAEHDHSIVIEISTGDVPYDSTLFYCGDGGNYYLTCFAYAGLGAFAVRTCAGTYATTGCLKNANNYKFVVTKVDGASNSYQVYYVKDGVIKTSNAERGTPQNPANLSNTMKIGSTAFIGTVHDLKVYDVALTEAQIKEYLGVTE